MDFAFSDRTEALRQTAQEFLRREVIPAEPRYQSDKRQGALWDTPPVIEELKRKARARGLWNLFLPAGPDGLSNLDYAPIAEISGMSPWIMPEAMNCSAPDTGNMEILLHFATDTVRDRWLAPLLNGEVRSAYSMTEPAVASSDARNISLEITEADGGFLINGRKWWSSGAMSPRCKVAIVMGKSDPTGEPHRQQSMVVVPLDTPGVNIIRSTSVFGYDDSGHGGHAEIVYDNVWVPRDHLLGELHGGFAIAQARLGPGRIHHAMRLVGMAERAFELMCERAFQRTAFGRQIAEQGVFCDWVAEARIRIEQVRLLVLKTAWLMDTVGNKGAAVEISAIKIAAPRMATWVIDHAIQTFGGAGVSQDTPLAEMYQQARMLRIADGPDDVHKMALARRELRPFKQAAGVA